MCLKLTCLSLSAALLLGAASDHSPKISKDLHGRSAGQPVNVIVQFGKAPLSADFEKISRRGGVRKKQFAATQAASYSISADQIESLAADPNVSYVSLDRPVKPTLNVATAAVGADLTLSYGFDGRGIGIAIIDSGVRDAADDLKYDGRTRVVYKESFLDNTTDPKDEYGHGTHVAGVAAGNGRKSMGSEYKATLRGMAPRAHIVNLRVLDKNGAGKDSDVIDAIERAIQLRKLYNIRVINLSLGRPVWESYTTDPLCKAVKAAWEAGIVVVVAAGNDGRLNNVGNDGYGTIGSPANSPWVITVGAMNGKGTATRSDDVIASYSSKGPSLIDHIVKPDIVAPGNRIASIKADGKLWKTYTTNRVMDSEIKVKGGTGESDYFRLSGTSIAAPMVSGAVALLLQKAPALTPDQVKARLMKTARKNFPVSSFSTDPATGQTWTVQYDIFTIGAGYLDVFAALASNETAPAWRVALSPTSKYDPARGAVSLDGMSTVWGGSAVWGDTGPFSLSAVWGDTVFLKGSSAVWGDTALWGSSAVWGDRVTQGFSAVWGDTAIWGTSAVWGDSADWGDATVQSNRVEAASAMIVGEQ